jgi:hypothetical protein
MSSSHVVTDHLHRESASKLATYTRGGRHDIPGRASSLVDAGLKTHSPPAG